MSKKVSELSVHKFTLSSGKSVLIREMRIKDQELAAKAAGAKGGDNQLVSATLMQKELIKLLVVGINDKPVIPREMEDLDGVFTFQEYNQVSRAVQKVMGSDGDEGNLTSEIVSFGGI